MKLQILVTTMHQRDFKKLDEMQIKSDVIFANQADRYAFDALECDGFKAQMITTPARGASRNRNTAIEYSSKDAEYIMFSDDDLVFLEGYEKLVLDEFEAHPEAEAIKFNLYDISKTRKIAMKKIDCFKKATRRNVASMGICGMVVKRDVLLKKNLRFNESFGPGCEDYCGEDTIFLQDMIKRGVKFYLSPVEIAGIDQTESSWFEGFNEKYFYVKGKLFAAMYPRAARLLAIRSSYRFAKRQDCKLSFKEILKIFNKGIKDYLR